MTNSTDVLDNVCESIIDCLHTTAPTEQDGYPLIRTPNIGRGRLHLDNVHRVSKDVYETWTRRAVPRAGDLILAREARAGNVAIIRDGQQVCLGQRTVLLRPDPSKVDPHFLCYFLLAPAQQGALLSGETGATSTHVNMADIRRLPLKGLPPPATQHRVGRTIATYDDLIENNRQRIRLLEQAARLLYEEWFVRLRFPGHEQVSVIDGVPRGWKRKQLAELCKDIRESVDPRTAVPDTAYIGLEHIPRRSITLGKWTSPTGVDSTKFSFLAGDILFGKIRPYFHKVGFTLVDGITSADAIVVRPVDRGCYEYLLLLLSSDQFVSLASKTVREGSKMPRADWKFLLGSEFLVPAPRLLNSFGEVLRPVLDQLRNLALSNRRFAATRDLLLPRLMNREIAV